MKKRDILIGLLAALFLAFFISPFSAQTPDGLERVAGDNGFSGKSEAGLVFKPPVPDYAWPGIKDERIATSAAGMMGVLIVFGLGYGLAILLKRKGSQVI